MSSISLPFEVESPTEVHGGDPFSCTLYKMLPEPMQDRTRESVYLLEYLHMIPTETMGIPEYHPKLSRQHSDIKEINLIYPVEGGLFIHVIDDPQGGRGYYISIEPQLSPELNEQVLVRSIEVQLLRFANEFDAAETPDERREVLEGVLDRLCGSQPHDESGLRGLLRRLIGKASEKGQSLNSSDLKTLKYIMSRDKLGMGILEPMMRDTNIEDISCSGLGSLFVEHKFFKSLRTAFAFTRNEELDEFVLRLAEGIKKPVTFRNPIVDATLPDGSRINIVYGTDVSKRGSNFTIRKFSETPLSITELVSFGSLDYTMASYLSIVIGEGMNVFVSGETASGKTTLLNALNTFMHPDAKVDSLVTRPV